jgi:hypothetical protein
MDAELLAARLLERPLALSSEDLELIEALLAEAALRCQPSSRAGQPPREGREQTVDARGERVQLFRVGEEGAWPVAETTIEDLARAAGFALEGPDLSARLEPLLSRVVRWLDLSPRLECARLPLARFWRVVERVQAPETERALSELPQGDFEVGDEVGVDYPRETQLVVWV